MRCVEIFAVFDILSNNNSSVPKKQDRKKIPCIPFCTIIIANFNVETFAL